MQNSSGIRTSQLATISDAVKACTFRVVALATETGPQTYLFIGCELAIPIGSGWVQWREIGGRVSCHVIIATSTGGLA